MTLSKEQIKQIASQIELADVKAFIEKNQKKYQKFLEYENKEGGIKNDRKLC